MTVLNRGTAPVAPYLPDEKEHLRHLANTLNQVIQGKINATIDVTLTASSSTTTINDARIGYYSAIIPAMALTFNAATDIAGGIYVPLATIKQGQCVVHHRPDIATDRIIRFLIIG